ncbi:LOW QUALITY PROTEIN: tropomyosin, muscle-like [Hibiscus syriacus]|uniref:LOW QUALITY PROTEIN: tropomyosin, muscle-like n=1 Tax=Hibiscus syriacus TaxID=106335 RepID=UPI00192469FD|nr:LOW QUALITY PROTEIN: tropomyosin, muscle-like [Hibiscus syriacus]
MAVNPILLPAIFTRFLFFSLSSQNQLNDDNRNLLIRELDDAKLNLSRLESVLDETIQRIDAKTLLLKEREKLLEDMENKITYLRSVLSSLKDESLLADERLKALQEEVHLLWDVSRKNNFELHVLELKAQDAEERLEAVTSKVEKVGILLSLISLPCRLSASEPLSFGQNPLSISFLNTCLETNTNIILHSFMLVNMIAESVLDGTIQRIDAKTLLLKEREKLLEDMENKITYLRSVQSSLKDESLLADERLKALQEEVHLLWDVSRKNNFELHVLELKAQDAEERLEAVTSKVEKTAEVVTEQWIQIQHLEQALQIAQSKYTHAHAHTFTGNLCIWNKQMSSFLSVSWQLQGFIKQEMRRNEFTATFANDELVFFLASALITFPVLSAWMALSSRLN